MEEQKASKTKRKDNEKQAKLSRYRETNTELQAKLLFRPRLPFQSCWWRFP